MKYFKNASTIEELKKQYRKLASIYHPDNLTTGDTEIMKTINNEYEKLFNILQKTDTKADKKESSNDFINIINELIKYNDLVIDIIGSWIWLDGSTYSIKDTLKTIGFLWSKSRKKWYYNGEQEKSKGHYTKKSYNDLKNTYGCHTIETKKNEKQNNKSFVLA